MIEAHIIRKTNDGIEFLLLKRSLKEIYPNIWQMVTGSREGEEKSYQTAIREIQEETGLTPYRFFVVPYINSFYSPQQDRIIHIPVFLALVNNESEVKISDEHSEYMWCGLTQACKMVAWPGQRISMEIIEEYFGEEKTFLHFTELKV